MNRTLILPAVVAAGLHVALLGFRSSTDFIDPSNNLPTFEDDDSPVLCIEYEPPENSDEIERFDPQDPPPPPLVPQQAEYPVIVPTTEWSVLRPPTPEVLAPRTTLIDPNWRPPSDSRVTGIPVFALGELENVPRAFYRHSPKRPPGTGTGSETVTLDFVVGKDGTVAQVRVVDSTDSALEDTCIRTVRRWRFEPGMRRNLPVAFRMQQTFVFTAGE